MQRWYSRRQPTDLKSPLIELRETLNPVRAHRDKADAAVAERGSDSSERQPAFDSQLAIPWQVESEGSPSEIEQRFLAWRHSMGFTDELLNQQQVDCEALKALYIRDTAPSKLKCLAAHWLRPRSLEYAPERLWLALSMRPAWVSESLAKKACWDPREWVWVRGIAIPMVNIKGYALKLMMSNLWRGGVAGFKLTLHGILIVSLGLQLKRVFEEGPEAVWTTLFQGESETWKRLIYSATGTSARVFWPLIFAPTIILALAQMVIQTTRTLSRGRGRLVQLTALLNRQLEHPSLWRSWIRPLLPLDQPSFEITALADQLTFDGRPSLTPAYRQNAARYLILAMDEAQGSHKHLALKELTDLTIGAHIHNLEHYRASSGTLSAAIPLSHLMVRIGAMQALERIIRSHPVNRRAMLYREWAYYHAWMAGRSTDVVRTVSYLAMHVGLTAYFFYGFKVIVEAIQAYLDCPDKTGVSVTGIADWSSDYTQPCFDAYLEFFRKIPGQPIAFLLDIIPRVHFSQTAISLDLSYKEMNATEITLVLQALTNQGVSVFSLDLTGNSLATAQDYNTFMPALAGIRGFKELILVDVGLESGSTPEANVNGTEALAGWLPNMKGLSSITIVSQWLGYSSDLGVQALATGIARCASLEAINIRSRIGWTQQSEGLSRLAASIAQLRQLKSLTLSEVLLYTPQMLAWSQALSRLKQLRHLRMRDVVEVASPNVTKTFVQTFAKLQQLETLDLTNTVIGVAYPDDSSSDAVNLAPLLAESVRSLPQLSELRLNNTFLGFNQSWEVGLKLFEALEARTQPLSVLELADNHFSHNASFLLNALLNRWQLPTMPVQFRNAHDVRHFYDGLPPTQIQLDFEDGPQNDEALGAVFKNTAKSSVVSLTLDGFRFEASARGFEGLGNCTQLKKLELGFLLGDLTMGLVDTTSVLTLLHAISHLSALESLSITSSFMLVGMHEEALTVAQAFALALARLTRLRHLNLQALGLGAKPKLDLIIMDALTQLRELKTLDIPSNFVRDSSSFESLALVSRLPLFRQLTRLDISQSFIGTTRNVTRQIAHFLATVDRPFFLNGTKTRLGKYPDEARALMIAIANNPYVTAELRNAGFGSELWPPAVARLASQTYDPYLEAACSNLQCFGVQPSLPDLSNRTRINFREEQGSIHDPLAALTPFILLASSACLVLALSVGLGWLLGCGRRQRVQARPKPAAFAQSRVRSDTTKRSPIHSSRLRAPLQQAREKVKEKKCAGLDVPGDQIHLQLG